MAITVPVLILFAKPAAKQGPLIAEILISEWPSFSRRSLILSDSVVSSLSTMDNPFVNKTIGNFFL